MLFTIVVSMIQDVVELKGFPRMLILYRVMRMRMFSFVCITLEVDELPRHVIDSFFMKKHWGFNPGPSACGADVIPLHHVPVLLGVYSCGLNCLLCRAWGP